MIADGREIRALLVGECSNANRYADIGGQLMGCVDNGWGPEEVCNARHNRSLCLRILNWYYVDTNLTPKGLLRTEIRVIVCFKCNRQTCPSQAYKFIAEHFHKLENHTLYIVKYLSIHP